MFILLKMFRHLSNKLPSIPGQGELLKGMFFVYTGIGLPTPKSNYLIGTGVDIVSGLSLNAGFHIVRISQPEFLNGSFSGSANHFYRSSFYFGLTADPAVITDIIKLF